MLLRQPTGLVGRGDALSAVALSLHGRDESIPAPREGLDESRCFRGVRERFAQALDRRVHPLLEVDEGVARPQPLAQFFPGDELAGPFQQALEHPERLVLETHAHARPTQFAGAHVQLEHAEPDHARRLCGGCFHRISPSPRDVTQEEASVAQARAKPGQRSAQVIATRMLIGSARGP
jgi:hypothetical protein